MTAAVELFELGRRPPAGETNSADSEGSGARSSTGGGTCAADAAEAAEAVAAVVATAGTDSAGDRR